MINLVSGWFLIALMMVGGCVAVPTNSDYRSEDLAVVENEESEENGIIPPPNMLDLDFAEAPMLNESPCVCGWEIREETGMICLREVCSGVCDLSGCREPVNVCQPL
jgi:hypothetical protein